MGVRYVCLYCLACLFKYPFCWANYHGTGAALFLAEISHLCVMCMYGLMQPDPFLCTGPYCLCMYVSRYVLCIYVHPQMLLFSQSYTWGLIVLLLMLRCVLASVHRSVSYTYFITSKFIQGKNLVHGINHLQ